MRRPLAPVLAASLVLACAPPDDDASSAASDTSDTGAAPPLAGPPELDEACVGELSDPTRLAITTTDFSTGALSILDLATGELHKDLALATTDSLPVFSDGRLIVLHRYTFDALDLLAPDSLARSPTTTCPSGHPTTRPPPSSCPLRTRTTLPGSPACS